MEPAVGALQYRWLHPDSEPLGKRDDYFAELVEHLTVVTPEIDRRIARLFKRRAAEVDADVEDPRK